MFDSPWHWLVVAAVAFVLFFGWKQLPDMSRSLGRSLRIFKTEIKGMTADDEARDAAREQPPVNAEPRELEPGATAAPLPRADVVRNRPRPTPGGASGAATPRTDSQGSASAR